MKWYRAGGERGASEIGAEFADLLGRRAAGRAAAAKRRVSARRARRPAPDPERSQDAANRSALDQARLAMTSPAALPDGTPPRGVTTVALRVNGEERVVAFPTHHTLLEVLREECGLTGTKHGCELGECGTCTVLVDGRPVLSCLVLAAEMEGRAIETVEGLAARQRAPSAAAHLRRPRRRAVRLLHARHPDGGEGAARPNPSRERAEINEALAGNLCRCTGYHKIVQAVEWAGAILRGDDERAGGREWLLRSAAARRRRASET